jgi:DNA-directed RNA polymerase specialized sigma24 family protein
MMRELQNLHWYYRTLIQQKYFEGLTLSEMRQKYNITLGSLTKDIKIGYAIIREKCNCELK